MKKSIKEMLANKRTWRAFRRRFEYFLLYHNEYVAAEVTTEHILNTFDRQGYWSGDAVRVYYGDNNFYTEQRNFGEALA